MIRYLLDSATCNGYLSGSLPQIGVRLRRHRPAEIGISALTLADLLQAARRSRKLADNLRLVQEFAAPLAVLPFDAAAADTAARLQAEAPTETRGRASWDLLLAATALERGLTLVTPDLRAFSRVPGLFVEDWSA